VFSDAVLGLDGAQVQEGWLGRGVSWYTQSSRGVLLEQGLPGERLNAGLTGGRFPVVCPVGSGRHEGAAPLASRDRPSVAARRKNFRRTVAILSSSGRGRRSRPEPGCGSPRAVAGARPGRGDQFQEGMVGITLSDSRRRRAGCRGRNKT